MIDTKYSCQFMSCQFGHKTPMSSPQFYFTFGLRYYETVLFMLPLHRRSGDVVYGLTRHTPTETGLGVRLVFAVSVAVSKETNYCQNRDGEQKNKKNT